MTESLYRLTVDVGTRIVHRLERFIAWGSLVGNPAFFEDDVFPWIPHIEGRWKTIRHELDQVLERRDELPNFQDISADQRGLTQDDSWKTYFSYAYGHKAEGNCRRCPDTTRIIESIPGMKTAFFSILAAGKHIPSHRGPYKGVIRYHLGLIVPEPKHRCRICVSDEVRHWEEGKSLIFDDTYQHEVWNDTNDLRVVLLMDVVRPLRFPANGLNWLLLKLIGWSPFVQDGVQNYQAWERKFDEVGTRSPQVKLSASPSDRSNSRQLTP